MNYIKSNKKIHILCTNKSHKMLAILSKIPYFIHNSLMCVRPILHIFLGWVTFCYLFFYLYILE